MIVTKFSTSSSCLPWFGSRSDPFLGSSEPGGFVGCLRNTLWILRWRLFCNMVWCNPTAETREAYLRHRPRIWIAGRRKRSGKRHQRSHQLISDQNGSSKRCRARKTWIRHSVRMADSIYWCDCTPGWLGICVKVSFVDFVIGEVHRRASSRSCLRHRPTS